MADNTETLARNLLFVIQTQGADGLDKLNKQMKDVGVSIEKTTKDTNNWKKQTQALQAVYKTKFGSIAQSIKTVQNNIRVSTTAFRQGSRQLHKVVTMLVGSIGYLSFSKIIKQAMEYRQSVASLAIQQNNLGTSFGSLNAMLQRTAANLSFTRQQTSQLFKSYTESTAFANLGGAEKIFNNIKELTGANKQQFDKYLGSVNALQAIYPRIDMSNKQNLKTLAQQAFMSGQIQRADKLRLQQLSSGTGGLDSQTKQLNQENQKYFKLLGQMNRAWQSIYIKISQAVMPVMASFVGVLQRNKGIIDFIVGKLPYLIGGFIALKVSALAIAAAMATIKGVSTIAGGVTGAVKAGGGVGGVVKSIFSGAGERGGSASAPMYTKEVGLSVAQLNKMGVAQQTKLNDKLVDQLEGVKTKMGQVKNFFTGGNGLKGLFTNGLGNILKGGAGAAAGYGAGSLAGSGIQAVVGKGLLSEIAGGLAKDLGTIGGAFMTGGPVAGLIAAFGVLGKNVWNVATGFYELSKSKEQLDKTKSQNEGRISDTHAKVIGNLSTQAFRSDQTLNDDGSVDKNKLKQLMASGEQITLRKQYELISQKVNQFMKLTRMLEQSGGEQTQAISVQRGLVQNLSTRIQEQIDKNPITLKMKQIKIQQTNEKNEQILNKSSSKRSVISPDDFKVTKDEISALNQVADSYGQTAQIYISRLKTLGQTGNMKEIESSIQMQISSLQQARKKNVEIVKSLKEQRQDAILLQNGAGQTYRRAKTNLELAQARGASSQELNALVSDQNKAKNNLLGTSLNITKVQKELNDAKNEGKKIDEKVVNIQKAKTDAVLAQRNAKLQIVKIQQQLVGTKFEVEKFSGGKNAEDMRSYIQSQNKLIDEGNEKYKQSFEGLIDGINARLKTQGKKGIDLKVDENPQSVSKIVQNLKSQFNGVVPDQIMKSLNELQVGNKQLATTGIRKNQILQESLSLNQIDLQMSQQKTQMLATQTAMTDELGGGVRASIEMRQRELQQIKQSISLVDQKRKVLIASVQASGAEKNNYKQGTAEFEAAAAVQKNGKLQLLSLDQKRMQMQKRQLDIMKVMRDGWISAVTAQTIGSGRITKLMVSGTQNMRQGLDSFNALVSSQSGTTAKRSGAGAGFTVGTQIQANADGTVKYSGQQGGMAYRPSVGPDIDAANNQFKNLRQTSLQYKTGMQAQVVTTEKLTTNFDKLGTVLTNVADGMIKSFGIGGATVSGVNPAATGALLSGMSPALPSIVQQGGPLSQGGNVNINVTITGGANSEEVGKQIVNKLKEVISPMFNKSR